MFYVAVIKFTVVRNVVTWTWLFISNVQWSRVNKLYSVSQSQPYKTLEVWHVGGPVLIVSWQQHPPISCPHLSLPSPSVTCPHPPLWVPVPRCHVQSRARAVSKSDNSRCQLLTLFVYIDCPDSRCESSLSPSLNSLPDNSRCQL